jgi:glycosyltransferase involved in cell wall biosynthesis
MPAHNSSRHIYSSIQSVQSQLFKDWELIVSDDGSTDGTLDIVRGLASQDRRIRILTSSSQLGAARARNAAIATAKGRFIAFLDSDDIWKEEKLQMQITFMKQQGVYFSFTSYDRIDENGKYLNTRSVNTPTSYADLLKASSIGCLTAVYDTDRFGKVFMPAIEKRQDFALWLTLLKEVDYAYPIPESLAQYRLRPGSLSYRKWKTVFYTFSVYKDCQNMGLIKSSYLIARYVLYGLRTKYLQSLFRA